MSKAKEVVTEFAPGQLVKNNINQYARILSLTNGSYRLTGWAPLEKAKTDRAGLINLNEYGLGFADAEIVEGEDIDIEQEVNADEFNQETKPVLHTKSSLNKLSADDVKALATTLDLPIEGTKPEIIDAILEKQADTK